MDPSWDWFLSPLPDRSLKHLAALTGPPRGTFFAKLQTRQLNVYLRRMGPLGVSETRWKRFGCRFFFNTSSKCGDVQDIFLCPVPSALLGDILILWKGKSMKSGCQCDVSRFLCFGLEDSCELIQRLVYWNPFFNPESIGLLKAFDLGHY